MKKVVIFGGGSGLSQLLKGLKEFPIDITAVVSMSDNGSSTGALREEFDIPAVGDITKVLMSMSTETKEVKSLFNYRFAADSSLGNNSIKNLIMTALLEQHGSFSKSLPILCDLLDVKGKILPLTEDNVDLIGITKDGKKIVGEHQITDAKAEIERLEYTKKITVFPKVLDEIKKADLIIFSSGSLLTSILPHIIVSEIQEAVNKSKAKKMYICNIITQPGETDSFSVSDHISTLEKYLGVGCINVVIANTELPKNLIKFAAKEGKTPVNLDNRKLSKTNIEIISDKVYKLEDGAIRHDSLKTAYLIFSYLINADNLTK